MPSEPGWRSLILRLLVSATISVVAVAGLRTVGILIAPTPALVVGLTVGALSWLVAQMSYPEGGPRWERPEPPMPAAPFSADRQTRRTATMLANAQPGRAFDARPVAQQLATITADRLVRNRHLAAEDPLTEAENHLSPVLLAYLRAAEDDKPPTLTRRALRAHLKEIDRL